MKHVLVGFLGLLLAACGDDVSPRPEQPAQGLNPAGQYDQGYAWALSEQIEDPEECDDGESDLEYVNGCKTFAFQRLQMLEAQQRQESMDEPQFEAAPSGPSDFDMGYAWAQQQDLNKADACKKQRGTISYREGCAAYVRNRLGVNPNE